MSWFAFFIGASHINFNLVLAFGVRFGVWVGFGFRFGIAFENDFGGGGKLCNACGMIGFCFLLGICV